MVEVASAEEGRMKEERAMKEAEEKDELCSHGFYLSHRYLGPLLHLNRKLACLLFQGLPPLVRHHRPPAVCQRNSSCSLAFSPLSNKSSENGRGLRTIAMATGESSDPSEAVQGVLKSIQEAGALDALTKYLSLGPQDAIEEATADLLRILFSSPELRRHESAVGAVNHLVAVLRLGTRALRYSAARALQGLFTAENIRAGEAGKQAIVPLVEMLNSGSEKEQRAAIGALTSLSADNTQKALAIADTGANGVEGLCQVLSSDCSSELKEYVAELCRVLFANSRVRTTPTASNCIKSLVALLSVDSSTLQHAGARALDNLLDDEQQAELVAAQGAVVPLVGLVVGDKYPLHEAVISALTKLGKDRPLCKLHVVKAKSMKTKKVSKTIRN